MIETNYFWWAKNLILRHKESDSHIFNNAINSPIFEPVTSPNRLK